MLNRFTYPITPPYVGKPVDQMHPIPAHSPFYKDTAVHYRATFHTYTEGSNPQQMQGACYWKDNKVIVLNTDNTTNCMLTCLNLTTNTIDWQTEQTYPFGHGNALCTIGNDLYITNSVDNAIYKLNLDTFSYTLYSTARPYSTISYDAGVFYGCSAGKLYSLSVDLHTDTLICQYDNSLGLVQCGFIKDDTMYQIYAFPNLLVSYSIKNGEILNIYNLKAHSNGYPIGEAENCFYYPDADCIMVGSSARYRDNYIGTRNYKLNQLFLVGNVSENYPLIYTGNDGVHNANLTSNRNIYTDVSTTSIYQTGTRENPLRFFADACGLASLLDRSDVNIRVTHTGDASHGYVLKSGTIHLDVESSIVMTVNMGVHAYIDGGGSCSQIINNGNIYLNDTTTCLDIQGTKGSTSICKGPSNFTGSECTVDAGTKCQSVSGTGLTISASGTVNFDGSLIKQLAWLHATGTPRLIGDANGTLLYSCTSIPAGYELVFDLSAFKIIKAIQ